MRYVTAAYGPGYRRWASALCESFARYNAAPLTVFSDGPVVGATDVRVNALPDLGIGRTTGNFELRLKTQVMGTVAVSTGDDVCWIDCDQLVFYDLDTLLVPGKFNVVGYGIPGAVRDCGDGIKVPQSDYLLSGLFSMTTKIVSAYVSGAEHKAAGGEGSKLREQELVNRVAVSPPYARDVNRLDLTHPDIVCNFAWGGHPTTTNRNLASLECREDGSWWVVGKRLAVLCWISTYLHDHVSEGFELFRGKAREELRRLYGC